MMFAVGLIAVLVSLVLAMARAIMGPTMFDRVLAANSTATLAVLSLSLLGFVTGRPDFLDIALVYALINFIGTIAVSKFVHFKDLAPPLPNDDPGDI